MSAQPAIRAVKVDCARRDERGRVTHLGGPNADGTRWTTEIAEAIALAQGVRVRYYISRGVHQFGLAVERGQLVTMADDGWSVASLPNCPG